MPPKLTVDTDDRKIRCNDCEQVPELYETPYDERMEYVVRCDCEGRGIDVSDPVSASNLTEPITGKWVEFDGGNPG